MKFKYSQDSLEQAVKNNKSVSDVLRHLGIKVTTSNHRHFSNRIRKLQLDISHFNGKRTNFGPNHKGGAQKLTADQILVTNRTGHREYAGTLRRALIEKSIIEQCEICKMLPTWNNKKLVLQIDHKNGDGLDNRLENLRFLCPNCHSQTENFGIKNKKI
jgi:hypothetical protein